MTGAAAHDRRPIRERLRDVYTEAEIEVIMRTRQEVLGGRTPGEMILSGRAEELHLVIDRFQDGVFW